MQNMNFPSVRGIGQAGGNAAMPISNQQGRGPMSRYTGPDARPAGGRRDGQNRLRTMLASMRGPNQNALANASPSAAFNRAGGLPGRRMLGGQQPAALQPSQQRWEDDARARNGGQPVLDPRTGQPSGGTMDVQPTGTRGYWTSSGFAPNPGGTDSYHPDLVARNTPPPQPTGGQGFLRQWIGGQQIQRPPLSVLLGGARPVPGQNVIPNPGGMRQMVPSSNLGGPAPTPYPGSGIGQPGGGIMALRSMGGRMPMENQGY